MFSTPFLILAASQEQAFTPVLGASMRWLLNLLPLQPHDGRERDRHEEDGKQPEDARARAVAGAAVREAILEHRDHRLHREVGDALEEAEGHRIDQRHGKVEPGRRERLVRLWRLGLLPLLCVLCRIEEWLRRRRRLRLSCRRRGGLDVTRPAVRGAVPAADPGREGGAVLLAHHMLIDPTYRGPVLRGQMSITTYTRALYSYVSDRFQICHSSVHKTHALYDDMSKW